MKITGIVFDNEKNWFWCELDNLNKYSLSYEFYINENVHVNDEVSDELYRKIEIEDSKNRAFQIALYYASYQPRTENEVILRLKRSKINLEHIDLCLEKLRHLGFLDDKKFTVQYVKEKSYFKKWSKLQLRQKLIEKGVSQKIIEDALNVASTEQEEENIEYILNKKYGNKDLKDKKEFAKVYRVLLQKGFPSKLILEKMKKILSLSEYDV